MAKPHGDVAASRILTLKVPPSAHRIIQATAARNFQTRTGFLRAAVEGAILDAETAPGSPPATADRPPPERANVSLPVWVTPTTYAALHRVAARTQTPLTALIRQAIEIAVAECGGPAAVFPATQSDGRRWATRQPPRLPGITARQWVGLRPSHRRDAPPDDDA